MTPKVYITIIGTLALFALFPTLAFGAGIQIGGPDGIQVGLPGDANVREEGPQGVVELAYQYALAVGGALAFGVLIYAGILWASAGGDTGKISEAKQWISGALWGLALLLGATIVLNIVNPDIIGGTIPQLPEIQADPNN